MSKQPPPPEIVVRVARDGGTGELFSEVWNKSTYGEKSRARDTVVIDRAKGRFMHHTVVINRAKALAKTLNVPYEEDFTWPCVANLKIQCKCPECIEAGRV